VNLWFSARRRCAPVGISLDAATWGSCLPLSARRVLVVVTSGHAVSMLLPPLPPVPSTLLLLMVLLVTTIGLLENLPAGHGACFVAPSSAGTGSRRVRRYSRSSQSAFSACAA